MERKIIKSAVLLSILLATVLCASILKIPSEAYRAGDNKMIKVNGLGFLPDAYKTFLIEDGKQGDGSFAVKEKNTDTDVFTGTLVKQDGSDFGVEMWMGDFSELREEGSYYIAIGAEISHEFKISAEIYEDIITANLNYFTKQRCGDTTLNWIERVCHLDDIALGGWHDASDVRKLTPYMAPIIPALAHALETETDSGRRAAIIDELKWGNMYFFDMQSDEGFIMFSSSHTGTDNNSENRWTDNIKGNEDDRIFVTWAASRCSHYYLVYGNAKFARLIRDSDPQYYTRLIEFCEKILNYYSGNPNNSKDYGPGIAAYAEMYKATGKESYKEKAVSYAGALMELQEQNAIPGTDIRGFFKESKSGQPSGDKVDCGWELIGLTEAALAFPEHKNAEQWKNSIDLYCGGYAANAVKLNPYGILPVTIRTDSASYFPRKLGSGASYRYFSNNDVGNNYTQLTGAVGLMQAYKVTGNESYKNMSQRLYDWVLGVNMFGASSVTGFGYNHITLFYSYLKSTRRTEGGNYPTAVPAISGGIVNGITSNPDRYDGKWRETDYTDQPEETNGSWQAGEYWGPAVSYALWYESLSRSRNDAITDALPENVTQDNSPSQPNPDGINWIAAAVTAAALLLAGAGIFFWAAGHKKRKLK